VSKYAVPYPKTAYYIKPEGRNEEKINAYRILIARHEYKRAPAGPRRRCEENII
jgi:hypothetical protein